MPQPAVIEGSTVELKPPPNSASVGPLAIRHEEVSGLLFMRSAWDFDSLEVLRMLNGGKVLLGISGTKHPVVHLDVGPMPADFEPAYTVRQFTSTGGARMVRVETLRVHDGTARRVYAEEPITCGIAVAVGSAVDKVEDLCRLNGWLTAG